RSGDHLGQRALAAAARSNEPDSCAGCDGEGDIVHRRDGLVAAAAVGINLGYAADDQRRNVAERRRALVAAASGGALASRVDVNGHFAPPLGVATLAS